MLRTVGKHCFLMVDRSLVEALCSLSSRLTTVFSLFIERIFFHFIEKSIDKKKSQIDSKWNETRTASKVMTERRMSYFVSLHLSLASFQRMFFCWFGNSPVSEWGVGALDSLREAWAEATLNSQSPYTCPFAGTAEETHGRTGWNRRWSISVWSDEFRSKSDQLVVEGQDINGENDTK